MYKLIVFDMDDTIGAFPALSRDMVARTGNFMYPYALFEQLLETNSSYLRPGMLNLLDLVLNAKKLFPNVRIVLCTNNQSSEWIDYVVFYLAKKLGVPQVFDKVVDGCLKKRPTLEKSVEDLFRWTKYPKNSSIFFVDDQMHPKMVDEQVVYFHIAPYNNPTGEMRESTLLCRNQLVKFLQCHR